MSKKLENVKKVEKCQKIAWLVGRLVGWLVFEVHGSLLMSGRNLESIGAIEAEILTFFMLQFLSLIHII